MPPKRGTKRKANKEAPVEPNGDVDLAPPNRDTWPGWVELESEPAFFNVMLKDMGVRGVKIHEILGLDEAMMATIPLPIHALIFLFKHDGTDVRQTETECPEDVWFANQIPDFACASVALLNIVNNIKGLQMGKEMRDFKDFTKDMDSMARGDAIDGFGFLRRIHNSFARETDLLNADIHLRDKVNKAKKRLATIKAKETKEAKKTAADTPEKEKTDNALTATRVSKRAPKPATTKTRPAKTKIANSRSSSPLSELPDSDPEFTALKKSKKDASSPPEQGSRRSARQPKPRKDPTKLFSEADVQPDVEGYHYVAYLPVNGRVWKLDGLDSYPHLVGEFDTTIGGDWMNVAGPEIQALMAAYEDDQIEFNLMAVVHDPAVTARSELAENVRELQAIDHKLDAVMPDWKTKREDADPAPEDIILGPSAALDLDAIDLDAAQAPKALEQEITAYEDSYIDQLVRLRKERVKAQAPLRGAVRDHLVTSGLDEEQARMGRHDWGPFVKGWLGALADEGVLKGLVDDAV